MSALVHVLETAPPADIVYQHSAEVGTARAHIGDELLIATDRGYGTASTRFCKVSE